MTSWWSPKMERPCAASARAATWKTVERQLARDLVHVGDHEQEPLRRGERGGEGAGLQGAVHGAGGAAFGLHFDHGGNFAPQIPTFMEASKSAHSPMLEEGVMG
jgi:hypothetical protein